MDEEALNELLECSVCLERLDHTSKVLPCQHTFCRRCLEEILSTKRELRCPECRTVVTIRVEDLPPNILLVRLLEGLKTQGHVLGHTNSTENTSRKSETSSSSSSNVQLRQQRQNVPCAKALFHYEAKESGDLSFKKNDIVVLRKQIDENWYHGELNGQHGFFPINYVQVIVPLAQLPQCQALYDFDLKDEKEKDCLSFQKDETLTVIRKVDDNWIEGKKGDKIGIFPVTFVKLNDAAKGLLTSKTSGTVFPPNSSSDRTTSTSTVSPSVTSSTTTATSHPSTSQKRHSFTLSSQNSPSSPNQHHRRSLEISNTGGVFSIPGAVTATPPLPATPTAPVITSTPHLTSSPQKVSTDQPLCPTTTMSNSGDGAPMMSSGLMPVYVASYSYKPQKDDELELKKGETYSVTEKCQDGWFKGQCLRTAVTGVFPGNYVQPTRHQSAFTPVSSNVRTHAPLSCPGPDATSETLHVNTSSSSCSPPPLLPRAPKNFTPSPLSSGGGHSSRSSKAAITVPPPGFNIGSSSKSNSSSSTSSSTATVHLPKRGSGWSHTSLAAIHHSMSASTNITPPNVVLGAAVDSHHGHSSKDKKDKKDRHEKESSREKRDKEKKSLVKRLASKSKKSKSSEDADTAMLVDSSSSHVRSGSFPESAGSVTTGDAHKKTGSFDSSATTSSAKPSRPKPLAREKYTCITPYPPQTEHELELQIGDVIYVHKTREDGWFKGTLARSGKTGLFPGSFVEKCS